MTVETLEVGFGTCDGTPVPEDGAFRVYDPLSFHAMILKYRDTNVTLLAGDVFSIEGHVMDLVKAQLADISWLSQDHILPCASHIGTCPILFQSYVNQPSEALKFFGREDWFAGRMAEAIRQAVRALRPAQTGWGRAPVPGVLYNRRSYDESGNLVMSNFKLPYPHPGLTYGEVDDHVYVLRVDDEDGSPGHAAVSFGCHALCCTDRYGHVSADYPGIARKILAGAGIPSMFLPGSIGNVVPVSRAGRTYQKVGNSVGGVALSVLERCETVPISLFKVSREVLKLEKFRALDLGTVESALEQASPRADGLQRFHSYGSRGGQEGLVTEEYPITVVRMDDVKLVHLPGEIFVETAAAIKGAGGNAMTVVLSGPTADVGYLSPMEAHAEGGMEPGFAGLSVEAEAVIRETACRMIAAC